MWWQRNGNAGNPSNDLRQGLTVTTTVVSTGSVPCPSPTPVKVTGFEHGAVYGGGATGLFSAVAGTGTCGRRRPNVDRGTTHSRSPIPLERPTTRLACDRAAAAVAVGRIYVRLAALPAANVRELLNLDATRATTSSAGLPGEQPKFTCDSAPPPSRPPIGGKRRQLVPGRAPWSPTNPERARWQIDGVAQTRSLGRGRAAPFARPCAWFDRRRRRSFTANYDDVLISASSGDYPIGGGTVFGLRPTEWVPTTPRLVPQR